MERQKNYVQIILCIIYSRDIATFRKNKIVVVILNIRINLIFVLHLHRIFISNLLTQIFFKIVVICCNLRTFHDRNVEKNFNGILKLAAILNITYVTWLYPLLYDDSRQPRDSNDHIKHRISCRLAEYRNISDVISYILFLLLNMAHLIFTDTVEFSRKKIYQIFIIVFNNSA